MISEVSRVVKDYGKYLIISFGFPSLRMYYFKKKNFTVTPLKILTTEATVKDDIGTTDDTTAFWVYCCTKQACNTDNLSTTSSCHSAVLDSKVHIDNTEEVEEAVKNLQFMTNPLCKN